jgi:flagellar basal body-associated protein FliL
MRWEFQDEPPKSSDDGESNWVVVGAVIVVIIIVMIILVFLFILKPKKGKQSGLNEPTKEEPFEIEEKIKRKYDNYDEQYKSLYGDSTAGTSKQLENKKSNVKVKKSNKKQ